MVKISALVLAAFLLTSCVSSTTTPIGGCSVNISGGDITKDDPLKNTDWRIYQTRRKTPHFRAEI